MLLPTSSARSPSRLKAPNYGDFSPSAPGGVGVGPITMTTWPDLTRRSRLPPSAESVSRRLPGIHHQNRPLCGLRHPGTQSSQGVRRSRPEARCFQSDELSRWPSPPTPAAPCWAAPPPLPDRGCPRPTPSPTARSSEGPHGGVRSNYRRNRLPSNHDVETWPVGVHSRSAAFWMRSAAKVASPAGPSFK